jgi:hypothetical protein
MQGNSRGGQQRREQQGEGTVLWATRQTATEQREEREGEQRESRDASRRVKSKDSLLGGLSVVEVLVGDLGREGGAGLEGENKALVLCEGGAAGGAGLCVRGGRERQGAKARREEA